MSEVKKVVIDGKDVLLGTQDLPETIDLGEGKEASLEDVVTRALKDSKLSPKNWNKLKPEERDTHLNDARTALVEEAAKEPESNPEQDSSTNKEDTEKPKGKRYKARVLRAFGDYQPNDVALLTAKELKIQKADGAADDSPEAVAYAESLGNPVPEED